MKKFSISVLAVAAVVLAVWVARYAYTFMQAFGRMS